MPRGQEVKDKRKKTGPHDPLQGYISEVRPSLEGPSKLRSTSFQHNPRTIPSHVIQWIHTELWGKQSTCRLEQRQSE